MAWEIEEVFSGDLDGRRDVDLEVPDDVLDWTLATDLRSAGHGTVTVLDADGLEVAVEDLRDAEVMSSRRGAFTVRFEGRGRVACWRAFARPAVA